MSQAEQASVATPTQPQVAESDPQPSKALPQDLQATTDRFWTLLDALVPEADTQIRDTTGKVYVLPSVLPARRQVKVLRVLRELMDLSTSSEAMAAIGSAFKTGDVAGGIGAALSVLDDERIFDLLDRAFVDAFPGTVPDGSRPSDVFPVEEMVSALLPFIASLLHRLGEGVRPVTQAMTTRA